MEGAASKTAPSPHAERCPRTGADGRRPASAAPLRPPRPGWPNEAKSVARCGSSEGRGVHPRGQAGRAGDSVLLRVERAASGPSPAAKRTSGAERESIQCPEQESFSSRKPGAGRSGARLKKRLRSRRVERSVTREAEHDDVGESGRTVVAPKFGPQVNRKPTRRCAFFGAAAVLAAVTSLSLRCSSEPLPVACGAAVGALVLLS